ncbi:hypothetical protein J0X14_14380 [Muricauda sp. CAU 1633]|uniref:hypothetical protein n=1 Tax=Allomuricauda sp. CAU 1633 TaxID=2816036 RepID=UPI001A8CE80E|nr:hypothetical protein [Muricauda sp. CAU 1633]MBO0323492.1 hypothetical protein [Muricauda sp. CAU 1633]
MEEIEFYTKFRELKKEKGLKWSAFGGLLDMSDATIRMAFANESLKDYEKEIIENHFYGSGKKVSFNDGELCIKKDGVSVTLDEISLFAGKNKVQFFQHPYFLEVIENKVLKKVNYLLNNPEELKKFLDS